MRHAIVVLLLAAPVAARAEERFGVGAMAGVPFGATAKAHLDSRHDAQTHVGVQDGELTWDLDILKTFPDMLPRKSPGQRIPVYAGIGLKIKDEHDGFAGIRFVGGVSLFDSKRPYEFFAEVAPVLRFSPREGGAFDGAVGIRRWF